MLLFANVKGAKWWTVLTVVACLGILLGNTLYFMGGATPRFLLEKGAWGRHPVWLAAFYFHIVGASLCLATGTPLLFPEWTRKHPAWHRWLGYIYVNAVLWMAAPTGLALALVAKGGWWGSTGFMLAGVMWWFTTWSGYRAIRRGDLNAHIRAMVRSYCWALSAPAFRVIQAVVFLLGMDDASNYILSLWLSIAASVWLAESCLSRARLGAISYFASRSPSTGIVS